MADLPPKILLDTLRSSLPADIDMGGAGDEKTILHCKDVLRFFPGKRLVCTAEWKGHEVVAKIFAGKRKLRDHRAEERGARLLQEAGILTPALQYSGYLKDMDASVLIFERINGAVSLKDAWRQVRNTAACDVLMSKAVSLLAQHHRSGIRQTDLHLSNFLFAGGEIYTIDTSHVVRHAGQVPSRHAIENLASLLSQMYVDDGGLHHRLFLEYGEKAGASCSERDFIRLQAKINRWRGRLKKNLFNKIFRECTAYAYRRDKGGRQICRREYLTPELQAFLDNIHEHFEGECKSFLKQGRSSTVCLAEVGGLRLVIKRYNTKGLVHSIRRAFRTSRAVRSWRNAHLLLFYGIATARPVAVIERWSGLLPGVCYYISEYVEGDNALAFFSSKSVNASTSENVARQITQLVNRLGSLLLSHGDMKATNLVITPVGPMLMDLDDLVQHRLFITARWAHKQDIERFMRNWQDIPQVHDLFAGLVKSGVC